MATRSHNLEQRVGRLHRVDHVLEDVLAPYDVVCRYVVGRRTQVEVWVLEYGERAPSLRSTLAAAGDLGRIERWDVERGEVRAHCVGFPDANQLRATAERVSGPISQRHCDERTGQSESLRGHEALR